MSASEQEKGARLSWRRGSQEQTLILKQLGTGDKASKTN